MGEEAALLVGVHVSVKQKGRALVKSPTTTRVIDLKTMEDNLPSYGEQHLQDALWEGE